MTDNQRINAICSRLEHGHLEISYDWKQLLTVIAEYIVKLLAQIVSELKSKANIALRRMRRRTSVSLSGENRCRL